MMDYLQRIENELIIRGVSYTIISDAEHNQILADIANPSSNTDVMKLEKAPKVAVYSPKSALPWDDAVTLVLTYAEIPYDVIFDDEGDGYSIYTTDASWSAHFEHTVAITKKGPDGAAGISLRFAAMIPGVHTLVVGTGRPGRWSENTATRSTSGRERT